MHKRKDRLRKILIPSLDSHHFWNIPYTDDIVKLYSEVWFQEYTQRQFLSCSTRSNIITESQLTALLCGVLDVDVCLVYWGH